MKNLIFLVILFISFPCKLIFAQSTQIELAVSNNSGHTIFMQCYPVSMTMNGENKYSLVALQKYYEAGVKTFDYNNATCLTGGNNHLNTYFEIPYVPIEDPNYSLNSTPGFNFDGGGAEGNDRAIGSFGRGVYKLTFRNYIDAPPTDSVLIEIDGGIQYDIVIRCEQDGFYYTQASETSGWNTPVKIVYNSTVSKYHFKNWNPLPGEWWSRDKEYGNYNLVSGSGPTTIPIDPRLDCYPINNHPAQNHVYPDYWSIFFDQSIIEERHGTLTLNLNINRDVNTATTFYTNSNYNSNHVVPAIRITDGATLKIRPTATSSTTLTMNHYTDDNTKGAHLEVDPSSYFWLDVPNSGHYANLVMNEHCMATVRPAGYLVMGNNSVIDIGNSASLTLENSSIFAGYPGSLILVQPYGLFCNKGAIIAGRLTVRYVSGNHYIPCDQDYTINDSTKMILSEGAILEIPDNKTLSFQGPETILQMDSSSSIKFGANSKIVFQNGARIKANYAKFTSATSNSNWAGIYLNDLSKDTIKNCTIENAVNGISIKNKNNSLNETTEDVVSTEISNCSFVNTTTNTTLVNAVYAYNSSDILFKGNSVYSNQQPNAFSIGVFLEYCSPSNVNIIGNTIYNTLNGINSIQSSPYIASNTITGQTGAYYGIFLDNSNATVEYNSLNNFYYSIDAIYSSPNILNNTFNNATTSNLNLRKNSIFILNPVISGSTSYMYGGMNTFNGNPSRSIIEFSEESYPSLDKGCNVVNTSSSDYLFGELPNALSGTLYATDNYWGSNFNSAYFNVSSGIVEYEPVFDGSSYPASDGYILSSIGFGLSDTLYYDDLGDLTSSDLFMQARISENQGLYTQAILKYKEIVSTYKESDYAVISLSRIFDCLQKMNTPVSKYSENNIYLTSLKTNNEYPLIIREIAEDFIIKGKAKLGNVTEAINDYQNIYSQNQNNNKGFHALLNKTCLELSIADTSGDGPNKIFRSNDEHKLAILNLLKLNKHNNNQNTQTNNNLPLEYKLGNNYPNPFNPTTKINFSIPKAGFVSLKIYDITGREVKTLVNEVKQAGYYTVDFNGSLLSSGVYFYRIQSGDFVMTKRMVLVK